MTLPVAESPHKISVRKTDEAVSVFDGSANSKQSFRAIGHAEYSVCSGKRPLVDVEDTSTSHLSSPTACRLVCETGQPWKNGRNRNARQALLSNLSLDYERWSLSPWGRCLHQAEVTARKSLWLMTSSPGDVSSGCSQMARARVAEGIQKQRCAFRCKRPFSRFRDELAWEVDRSMFWPTDREQLTFILQ